MQSHATAGRDPGSSLRPPFVCLFVCCLLGVDGPRAAAEEVFLFLRAGVVR